MNNSPYHILRYNRKKQKKDEFKTYQKVPSRPPPPPRNLELWKRLGGGGDKALATGFHIFKILAFFSSGYMALGGSNTREQASIALCVGCPPSPFHGPSSHKTIWRRRCRSATTRVTTRGRQEGGGERRGGEGDSCFDASHQ